TSTLCSVRATRCLTSADPIKPAPPVTTIFIRNPSRSFGAGNFQWLERAAVIGEGAIELLKQRKPAVLFRQNHVARLDRPGDSDVRIVPANSTFARGCIMV